MATQAQKAKVGLFLLVSIALIGVTLIYIAGFSTANEGHYRLKFTRSILGLTTGSPVVYLGVPVGAVDNVYVDGDGLAIVDIAVAKESVTLYHGVTATLMWYSPVAGTMAIDLKGGNREASPLQEGSFIPVKASLVTSFAEMTESVVKKFDSLMDQLSDMLHTFQVALKGMDEGAFTSMVDNLNTLVVDSDAFVRMSAEALEELDLKLQRALNEFTKLEKDFQYLTDDVGDTVAATKEFVELATEKLEPLDLEQVQSDLSAAFATIEKLGDKLDTSLNVVTEVGETVIHEADTIQHSVRDSLLSLTEAIDSIKTLVGDLQQDPASLIRGRGKPKGN